MVYHQSLVPEIAKKLHSVIIYGVYFRYWVFDEHLKPCCCNSMEIPILDICSMNNLWYHHR